MICAICDRAALNCELTPEAGWVCPSCLDNSDLRAGITRAENDLAEARMVAKELLKIAAESASSLVVPFFSRFSWLTETD
jgi:hypothetical protein